jgi:flagellar protein FlbD
MDGLSRLALQGRTAVILLTRLNGPVFALNPDLVERADCTPDTVITLVDGTKYLVAESLPDLVALVRHYRASVIADAQQLVRDPADRQQRPSGQHGGDRGGADGEGSDPTDNVVPLYRRER